MATPTSAPDPQPTPKPIPTATPQPAGPVALSSGEFGRIDRVHKGEGDATVYELADGRRVLRLENFKVTNGPDLYVYLSTETEARDNGRFQQSGAHRIARLKGNIGDQNYELPADLDLSRYRAVVIFCRRFPMIFSTAELVAEP